MEHTQKMFLVPQHQLDRLKQTDTDVSIRRAAQTELDKNMSEVLDSDDLDMYDKAKKYAGILQRYLSLAKQEERDKSVLTLSMPTAQTADVGVTAVADANDNDVIVADVLRHIPKKSQRNAGHILDSFKRASDKISWTKHGEVVINGQSIGGTHIFDLIKSVTASHNVAEAARPAGWRMFLKTIADLNIPLSVVPNMTLRTAISGLKKNGDVVDGEGVARRKRLALSPQFDNPYKTPRTTGKITWAGF